MVAVYQSGHHQIHIFHAAFDVKAFDENGAQASEQSAHQTLAGKFPFGREGVTGSRGQ